MESWAFTQTGLNFELPVSIFSTVLRGESTLSLIADEWNDKQGNLMLQYSLTKIIKIYWIQTKVQMGIPNIIDSQRKKVDMFRTMKLIYELSLIIHRKSSPPTSPYRSAAEWELLSRQISLKALAVMEQTCLQPLRGGALCRACVVSQD